MRLESVVCFAMDDIKRKLALIDKQLSWGAGYIHKQIISTYPLLFIAVGLISGILLQSTLNLSISIWLIILAVCAAAAVFLFILQWFSSTNHPSPITNYQSPITNYQYTTAYMALLCFACLGAIRLITFHQPKPNDIRNLLGSERKLATIRGVIVTDPYIQKNEQWKFAGFKPSDPTSGFYLKFNEIKTVDGWAKITGTVRVQVDEPVIDLEVGNYIQAYCWLERFHTATNPGQFDIAKYLARKNIFIAASIKSRDGIELLKDGQAGILAKTKRKFRETAAQALLGDVAQEEVSRGLLEALLLGYREDIDSETYQAFLKTGLLHFISLSGMHLGIFIGFVWWLCKTAGLLKRGGAIVCIIAICVFLLIVPPRAPTLRAAIIGFVFCASFLFRRRPNSINTLSLSAIILLLIQPTQLFDVGWQLSFASVLGIVLFCRRIHLFLYETITGLSWYRKPPMTKPFFRIIARPGPPLLRLLSTGISAWLTGAGILLYHFYTINPLTFLWTVVAFPFVALILTLGYLKIVLSFLLPTASWLLGIVVTGSGDALIWIVKVLAKPDISQILIGQVPLDLILLYYGLVLFAGLVYMRHALIKKVICAIMALAILISLGAAKWQRTYRDNLVIYCLDVGHGQAILAQLPGKANVLFDAGSLHTSDIGRRIVAPFLYYNGINKIDAIIISHNDVDHINGIPEIVEHCEVGSVYANESFFIAIEEEKWGTAKFLNDWLNENGPGIQPISKNLNLSGKAKITILWPTEQICQDKTLSDNDKSTVTLIEFAGRKILLCSDIERFAQQKLLELFPELKVDVLVVPHHSSAKTIESGFVESLDADISICSCGQVQYERLQTIKPKNKTKSFYTARDGAITICVDKDGSIRTATFTKNR